jgi:hypothetical protein
MKTKKNISKRNNINKRKNITKINNKLKKTLKLYKQRGGLTEDELKEIIDNIYDILGGIYSTYYEDNRATKLEHERLKTNLEIEINMLDKKDAINLLKDIIFDYQSHVIGINSNEEIDTFMRDLVIRIVREQFPGDMEVEDAIMEAEDEVANKKRILLNNAKSQYVAKINQSNSYNQLSWQILEVINRKTITFLKELKAILQLQLTNNEGELAKIGIIKFNLDPEKMQQIIDYIDTDFVNAHKIIVQSIKFVMSKHKLKTEKDVGNIISNLSSFFSVDNPLKNNNIIGRLTKFLQRPNTSIIIRYLESKIKTTHTRKAHRMGAMTKTAVAQFRSKLPHNNFTRRYEA